MIADPRARVLRLERLLRGLRTDLARLYARRAAGYTLATVVSAGSADQEIENVEASVRVYERMLADAYRDEVAYLSQELGLAPISEVAS